MTQTKPILYGGKLSYFSGKARAYLHYKKIDFSEEKATPKIYKTIIMPRIGYPMIPVTLMPDDTIIQDTTELMDYYDARREPRAVTPPTPRQRLVSSLMELYGDEWLVIPAMHYRWVYNRDFALAEFGTLALPHGNKQEQYEVGEKAAKMFEGSVPLLGATREAAPAIEKSYITLLHDLNVHFEIHDFLLGGKPCAGDFGLIGPLYAHLYRDPASGEIMKREAPAVTKWVERMIADPLLVEGDFLPNDAIPDTLLPVLSRMMDEQGPCLMDIIAKVSDFKSQNPNKKIPRAIGMHPFTVEGTTANRLIFPYTQWLAQRAFEPVHALTNDGKQGVNQLLTKIGSQDFIDIAFKTPVTRKNHRLVWRD